ncbi:DUF2849 domain-containing protein [Alphaproteobacteria bacterium]|nr:DUF2849 domain-containing protein [Alphaproteobacteria bacterium]MDB2655951.1 DUF2849 domain-containing protein [Alphaproteobacteria bacterium]
MAQHAAKGARFQAVTANRLSDGEVVYWSDDNRWVERFTKAEIADGADAADALLARAMPADFEAHVLEPYLFEVLEDGSFYKPASVRETIRAAGPTVRLDLGKQAGA